MKSLSQSVIIRTLESKKIIRDGSIMIDEGKITAGRKAADFIESGMTVGLGTGSTAYYFIDELGRRIRQGKLTGIQAVATSRRSQEQAQSLGIKVINIDMIQEIDVLVDGADEVTLKGNGIKGGGGALLYEKIVAMAAKKIIWIVTPDKLVETLGAFPLPVEVVPFGSLRLLGNMSNMGFKPSFRKRENDSLFLTDSGNYIFDLHLGEIKAPQQLALDLDRMVGIIEHGLFLQMVDILIVGQKNNHVDIYEFDYVQHAQPPSANN